MLNISKKRIKLEYIIAASIVIILSVILLRRPIIGVADNGDFARIMNSTGLYYLTDDPDEIYFGYVNRLYGTGYIIPFGGGYFSTQILLVLLAVFISGSFYDKAIFDIRHLAAIYIAIIAISAYYAVKGIRRRSFLSAVLTAILLIFIFCDTAYTSYFNSLYGEPVTLVFLLLMSAMAVAMSTEDRPSIQSLVLFGAGALFFAGAKIQNVPAGILAVLLFARVAALRKDKAWRAISVVSALVILFISLVGYISISGDIRICNKYQTVFFGILKGSSDPAGDLKELGLDPSYEALAGTNYFMDDYAVDIRAPEFKKMISESVSHLKVAAFYAKHPGRLMEKLETAAENGFKLNQGFGNYEKHKDTHYKQVSEVFNVWSGFKMKALPHTLLFVAAFFGVILLVLLYEYIKADNRHNRLLIEYFGFIALLGIIQFILPVIGDGEADLSKHLFLFNVCFDIFIVAAPVYAAAKIAALVRYASKKRLPASLR